MSRSSSKKKRFFRDIDISESKQVSSENAYDARVPQRPLAYGAHSAKYYLAGLVSLITFLIYLTSFHNEFINWDDPAYIIQNPYIQSFNFRFLRWAFLNFYESNWHPLTWVSHALDYAIWGLNPLGHHLTNNMLHVVNTSLVVILTITLMEVSWRKTRDSRLSAFLDKRSILITGTVTGLLFGLHPLHVESVAWVAERKDVLSAMFFLLSILMYVRHVRLLENNLVGGDETTRPTRQYLLSLTMFFLALLSKPMAVSLPIVLLILDWYPFGRVGSMKMLRRVSVEKLPFIALSFISSVVTILAQKAGGAIAPTETLPLSTRMVVAAKSLMLYLWKMIVPLNLVPFYPYPRNISVLSLEYLFPMVLITGITISCIVFSKKQKVWLSVWSYYVVTLIPVLGIIQVGGQAMADRYTYLPSIGPFLMIGLITSGIYHKVTSPKRKDLIARIGLAVIATAIFISMLFITVEQIGVWKKNFSFWTYVVERDAGVPVAHNNLALAYMEKGMIDKAIEEFENAIQLNPIYTDAYYNKGIALFKKGAIDQAIAEYYAALKLDPNSFKVHSNLALAYVGKGMLESSIEEYQIALQLNPDSADAHNNLGLAYGRKGLIDKAIQHLEMAVKLDPNNANAHINLGVTLFTAGKVDRAIDHYQHALTLNPTNAKAHIDLGHIYSARGSTGQAIEHFEAAEKLDPGNQALQNELARLYQLKK